MSKVQEQITSVTANTATVSSVGFGTMAYLNDNAAAIGAICAILSLIIALVFHVIRIWLMKKTTEHNRDKLIEEILGQIQSESPEAMSAVSSIRDRRKDAGSD